jgi:hypothetical protein
MRAKFTVSLSNLFCILTWEDKLSVFENSCTGDANSASHMGPAARELAVTAQHVQTCVTVARSDDVGSLY